MIKNNLIIKKIVVLLVLATVFFLIGCDEDPRVTYFNLRPIDDEFMLDNLDQAEASPHMEYWIGYQFGVGPLDLELAPDEHFYGVIELDDATDYFVAHIGIIASHDFHFVFKVFINYEEVAFRVRGEEEYALEFVLPLESGYQVNIPFTIDVESSEENATYKLAAGLFLVDSNQVINEENHDSFTMGFALNHDLIFGLGSDINFEPKPNATILSREEATNFIAIYITPELTLNEYGNRARPELKMQVRRGEEIELFFDTTHQPLYGYELENYLFIGLLNGQQARLNHAPFLFVDFGEHGFNNITDTGSFILDPIDEVGYYDFIVISVLNPKKRNSLINSFPPFISNRIIIEVIE